MKKNKKIVLFSTYKIEAKDGLLSCNNVSASLFQSQLLYRYFIGDLPTENNNNQTISKRLIYDLLGITPHPGDTETIKEFLESKMLSRDLPKYKISTELKNLQDNSLELYTELESGYLIEDFIKTVNAECIEVLREKVKNCSAPNLTYSEGRSIENSFIDRFLLYTLNDLDTIDTDEYVVYAIWPLRKAQDTEKWLNALSDEILKRHPDVKEYYLILHDRDLYNTTFKVERCDEVYPADSTCKRYVALFQHTNGDPVMDILSQQDTCQKVVAKIVNLIKTKYLCDMSEQIVSINPNENKFKEALNNYNHLKKNIGEANLECSCATLNAISVINEELKKRLQLNNARADERKTEE